MSGQQDDRIRERAYHIWEEEGRPEGEQEKHWHRAEAEFQDNTKKAEPAETEGATRALEPPASPPSLANLD